MYVASNLFLVARRIPITPCQLIPPYEPETGLAGDTSNFVLQQRMPDDKDGFITMEGLQYSDVLGQLADERRRAGEGLDPAAAASARRVCGPSAAGAAEGGVAEDSGGAAGSRRGTRNIVAADEADASAAALGGGRRGTRTNAR